MDVHRVRVTERDWSHTTSVVAAGRQWHGRRHTQCASHVCPAVACLPPLLPASPSSLPLPPQIWVWDWGTAMMNDNEEYEIFFICKVFHRSFLHKCWQSSLQNGSNNTVIKHLLQTDMWANKLDTDKHTDTHARRAHTKDKIITSILLNSLQESH